MFSSKRLVWFRLRGGSGRRGRGTSGHVHCAACGRHSMRAGLASWRPVLPPVRPGDACQVGEHRPGGEGAARPPPRPDILRHGRPPRPGRPCWAEACDLPMTARRPWMRRCAWLGSCRRGRCCLRRGAARGPGQRPAGTGPVGSSTCSRSGTGGPGGAGRVLLDQLASGARRPRRPGTVCGPSTWQARASRCGRGYWPVPAPARRGDRRSARHRRRLARRLGYAFLQYHPEPGGSPKPARGLMDWCGQVLRPLLFARPGDAAGAARTCWSGGGQAAAPRRPSAR